jgi:hypothetical protein
VLDFIGKKSFVLMVVFFWRKNQCSGDGNSGQNISKVYVIFIPTRMERTQHSKFKRLSFLGAIAATMKWGEAGGGHDQGEA